MSLALIEAARANLLRKAEEKEAARQAAAAKNQEVSVIRQITKDMFDDCMGILRAEEDPPSRQLPPINLVDNLLTRFWGGERRATRTYDDKTGEPIIVVLDGRPPRRHYPYAHLQVIGLPDSLYMSLYPDPKKIEICIRHHADPYKQWSYTDKPIEHPSELQPWRELVDILKRPQDSS